MKKITISDLKEIFGIKPAENGTEIYFENEKVAEAVQNGEGASFDFFKYEKEIMTPEFLRKFLKSMSGTPFTLNVDGFPFAVSGKEELTICIKERRLEDFLEKTKLFNFEGKAVDIINDNNNFILKKEKNEIIPNFIYIKENDTLVMRTPAGSEGFDGNGTLVSEKSSCFQVRCKDPLTAVKLFKYVSEFPAIIIKDAKIKRKFQNMLRTCTYHKFTGETRMPVLRLLIERINEELLRDKLPSTAENIYAINKLFDFVPQISEKNVLKILAENRKQFIMDMEFPDGKVHAGPYSIIDFDKKLPAVKTKEIIDTIRKLQIKNVKVNVLGKSVIEVDSEGKAQLKKTLTL